MISIDNIRTALNATADSWWARKADPGRRVRVTIDFSVPSFRSNDDVLRLFEAVVDPLSGGYRQGITVGSLVSDGPPLDQARYEAERRPKR